MKKDKVELEKQYRNLKPINLKPETKIVHLERERTRGTYGKQDIPQLSKCYACGLQEHQIKDCNTENMFIYVYRQKYVCKL